MALAQKDLGLWEACKAGELAKVKSLVGSGADPLARFYNSDDSLSVAAANGRVECVEFLLGTGLHSAVGKSEAICSACFDCQDEPAALACIRMLLDKESAQAIGKSGYSPLLAAASMGSERLLQEILPWGDPLASDTLGEDALMAAAAYGRPGCVEMLMSVSNLNAKNENGKSAVDIAEENGHPAVAGMIRACALSRKESIELRDQIQEAPAVRRPSI